jgi:hypothetical protein
MPGNLGAGPCVAAENDLIERYLESVAEGFTISIYREMHQTKPKKHSPAAYVKTLINPYFRRGLFISLSLPSSFLASAFPIFLGLTVDHQTRQQ